MAVKWEAPDRNRKRFFIYMLLIPLFTAAGALIFYNMGPALAGIRPEVRLAKEIRLEKETGMEAISKDAIAFKEAGKTENELYAEEIIIIERFRKASPWAGGFLGLSLGISLVAFTIRTTRTEYVPHRGKCYSCGRCFKYCPVEVKKTS